MNDFDMEALTRFINELLYETMSIDEYYMIMRRLDIGNMRSRFRTACHNVNPSDGGFNLAFNEETRSFTCFSACNCSYSLLSLIKKRRELLGQDARTIPSLKWLCGELDIPCNFQEKVQHNSNIYNWKWLLKYTKNGKQEIELPKYDKEILKFLDNGLYQPWIDYGITEEVMDKYNIGWYGYKQQVTIPCYDVNGDLIGIRIRNTDPNSLLKYKPLELLDGTEYNFPTNEVFYGENFNWVNVAKTKSVIICESEKTVLKYESWYGADNNICLALYGSVLSNHKLKKLLSWGCETFYIAVDSDFESVEYSDNSNEPTPYEKFESKVVKMYEMIKPYSDNVYVVYNNLGFQDCYKYSITDYTKEQFEQLWESKERILLP